MNKYILLLLLTAQSLLAQVEFKATVSKSTIGINERLRVDFTMNDDGDNFEAPAFEGFKIFGGPNQSVNYSWVNGRKSFSKSYSFFLMPTKKGTFIIKPASIEIGGKVYKTNPVKVTVGNAVAQPEPEEEEDPFAIIFGNRRPRQVAPPPPPELKGDGIHLVAEISNTNPYVNEPITAIYKLYVSPYVSVSDFREATSPKYNNFWSQSIDVKNLSVQMGKYNGEDYRYVILRKTVLYPQKAGKLTIEPLMLDITMQAPTGRRDMFGRMEYANGTKKVSAGAKSITVKALPETGKPEDFTGAVGHFDFKVKPSKTTLKAGESLQLEVSAAGRGNMKLFTLPKPVVPNALEMYDPEHKENVTTPLTGMQGTISDNYTIVPQYKGTYTIKPLTFSYFDLNTKSYKTLSSEAIQLNVLDGVMPNSSEAAASANKQTVTKSDQFAFIKSNAELLPVNRKDFLGSGLFYALLLAPFCIIPIIILAKKKKEAIDRDVTGNRIRQSNKLAKKFLSEASKQMGNKEPFYDAMERALHNFLKAKLSIETSEMSKENIQELLVSKKAQAETVTDFMTLMKNCEFARYAPSTSVAMQQDYDKAVSVISELSKQI
ncbi:BatD family protein [Flavobacterium suncheonense]|uniref:BatD protein n=2 Tax=Flavobacterium suncheonense TaxID=350894 RepID=A0A0A2MCN5_9FLAO|nr:BatD family protein [Flavobacterium suncheonense]KGO89168.1 BatD protein [Flavobacterium suncheonense GH29-5 = DSM 17707]